MGESTVTITIKNGAAFGERSFTSVRVEDDGAGVSDDLKSIILQRGVRLDSQTPGHGLGLHIVKGIVEAYDGELSITDMRPKGSCFKVVLN